MRRRSFLTAAGAAAPATAAGPVSTAMGAASTGAAAGIKPVSFTVTLDVRPGREAEFLALLEPVLDAMRHEQTFVNAVLHRDPEDASRFMIYETWQGLDDVLEVQVKRKYRRSYMARLPELLRSERRIEIWEPVRSDFA